MPRLRCHRDCIGSFVQSRISGRRSSLTLIAASPVKDLLLPGSRAPMYPYIAVHGPTYRENSHANHTWNPPSRQSACFSARNVPSVWVRSHRPLHSRCLTCPCVVLGPGSAHRPRFPQSRRDYSSFDRMRRSARSITFDHFKVLSPRFLRLAFR
jgi:hypothetical protein